MIGVDDVDGGDNISYSLYMVEWIMIGDAV